MENKRLNIFLLIPLVVTFSFGMDSYIPFIIVIKNQLNLSASIVQLSMSIYIFALAVGQIFIGLLSDYIGRKKALYLSTILFMASSVLCGFSTSGTQLIIGRFLQGIGACGLRACTYTMVKDCYDGDQASAYLTRLYSAVSLSPMVAPLIGGFVGGIWGWEAIFFMMVILGVALLGCIYPLPETYSKQTEKTLKQHFKDIGAVFRDKQILFYGCLSAAGITAMFCFVSSMSYIILLQYHLSQKYIYLTFVICGIGMFIVGMLSKKIISLLGSKRALYYSFGVSVFLLIVMSILSLLGDLNFSMYVLFSMLLISIAIILNGCSISMGVESRKTLIGLGISIIGVLGYGIAAISGWVLSLLPINTFSYGLVVGAYYLFMIVISLIAIKPKKAIC